MSDTTTITSSGTIGAAATNVEIVQIAPEIKEAVVTYSDEEHFSGIAVRVSKGPVVLRFEANALKQQRETEQMNERIRKYGKAY